MSLQLQPNESPGMNLGDIYYLLFRHKWKIVICSVLGVVVAYGVYKKRPPPFQSDAKLFVRYVISEGTTIGPPSNDTITRSPDQRGETIMNSEMEILRSNDLALQVAAAIGPERILADHKGEKTLNQASALIRQNLTVNIPPRNSVIHLSFRHSDPAILQPVLNELIQSYLKMHHATHRAIGVLGDLLIQETDQLRSKLIQTEEELRRARNKAGVISINEAKETYGEHMASLRQQIFQTQATLAERASALEELQKRAGLTSRPADNSPVTAVVPREKIDEHRAVSSRISNLTRIEQELMTQFTAENPRVKEIRAQLTEAEDVRKTLQLAHPTLASTDAPATAPTTTGPGAERTIPPGFDLSLAAAEITALQARVKELNSQFDQVRADVAKLDELEGSILELSRRKELEEANYRYYAASLEQSRINETLGTGRVSNIIPIQTPTPPSADWSKTYKLLLMIAGAGVGAGVAWAAFIEFFADRSIRRPADVERGLGLPLFLAIPALRQMGRRQILKAKKRELLAAAAQPTEALDALLLAGAQSSRGDANPESAPLGQFYDTLRDRLIGYFESKNLTHKPKLVAVSGLHENAGVTTIAAGLSRSLSETGEGNVLLVDMTAGQGSAQQFARGRAVCGLDELLDTRDSAHVQENLYVVSANDKSSQLSRNLPQRLSKLVPKLKASDFDYIIFDMPTISQISITPRLAPFMDMVLLVIESEKTNRDVVQNAASLLAETKSHVGVVLNKMRRYVPARLYQEL